jgi:hypothetical protein
MTASTIALAVCSTASQRRQSRSKGWFYECRVRDEEGYSRGLQHMTDPPVRLFYSGGGSLRSECWAMQQLSIDRG